MHFLDCAISFHFRITLICLMTWSISDEETVDKGAKFLSDRWIALEQGTQNHHQQIDQMMKILQLIKSEKHTCSAPRKSSIKGGSYRGLLPSEDADDLPEDRTRSTQLRFAG